MAEINKLVYILLDEANRPTNLASFDETQDTIASGVLPENVRNSTETVYDRSSVWETGGVPEIDAAVSGYWEAAGDYVTNASSDIADTSSRTNTLGAASSDWDSSRDTVFNLSDTWTTTVDPAVSGPWQSTYVSVNGASGTWDTAYTFYTASSDELSSVYHTVSDLSSGWGGGGGSIPGSLSDGWQGTYAWTSGASGIVSDLSTVYGPLSGDANTAITSVTANSSNWNSAYTYVTSVFNTADTANIDVASGNIIEVRGITGAAGSILNLVAPALSLSSGSTFVQLISESFFNTKAKGNINLSAGTDGTGDISLSCPNTIALFGGSINIDGFTTTDFNGSATNWVSVYDSVKGASSTWNAAGGGADAWVAGASGIVSDLSTVYGPLSGDAGTVIPYVDTVFDTTNTGTIIPTVDINFNDKNLGNASTLVIGDNVTAQAPLHIRHDSEDDAIYLDNALDSTGAGPVITLKRNSATPAAADYLGQLKFKGESSTGAERVYAKISAKIDDPDNTNEDGIIEFMNRFGGSEQIAARFKEDSFRTLNGVEIHSDGNLGVKTNTPARPLDVNGAAIIRGALDVTAGLDVTGNTTLDDVTAINFTTTDGYANSWSAVDVSADQIKSRVVSAGTLAGSAGAEITVTDTLNFGGGLIKRLRRIFNTGPLSLSSDGSSIDLDVTGGVLRINTNNWDTDNFGTCATNWNSAYDAAQGYDTTGWDATKTLVDGTFISAATIKSGVTLDLNNNSIDNVGAIYGNNGIAIQGDAAGLTTGTVSMYGASVTLSGNTLLNLQSAGNLNIDGFTTANFQTCATNWNSAYDNTNGLTAGWTATKTKVDTSSTDWNYAFTTVDSKETNWDTAYTEVNTNGSNWTAAYNWVNASAVSKWNNVYDHVFDTSDTWTGGGLGGTATGNIDFTNTYEILNLTSIDTSTGSLSVNVAGGSLNLTGDTGLNITTDGVTFNTAGGAGNVFTWSDTQGTYTTTSLFNDITSWSGTETAVTASADPYWNNVYNHVLNTSNTWGGGGAFDGDMDGGGIINVSSIHGIPAGNLALSTTDTISLDAGVVTLDGTGAFGLSGGAIDIESTTTYIKLNSAAYLNAESTTNSSYKSNNNLTVSATNDVTIESLSELILNSSSISLSSTNDYLIRQSGATQFNGNLPNALNGGLDAYNKKDSGYYGSFIQLSELGGGQNINNSTTTYVSFDTVDSSAGTATTDFTHNGSDTITINTAGTYEISVNLGVSAGALGTSNQRTNTVVRCDKSGTAFGPTAKTGYIRITTQHEESSHHIATFVTTFTAGQTLKVGSTRETGALGPVHTCGGECFLYVRRII